MNTAAVIKYLHRECKHEKGTNKSEQVLRRRTDLREAAGVS